MTNKNIKTSFTADTKNLESGLKRMETLLAQMNTTMGTISKTSTKSSNEMGKGFKKSEKAIKDVADEMSGAEKTTKKLQDQLTKVGKMPQMTNSQRVLDNFQKGISDVGKKTDGLDDKLSYVGDLPKMERSVPLIGRFINGLNGVESEATNTGQGIGRLGDRFESLGKVAGRLPDTTRSAVARMREHFQSITTKIGQVSREMVSKFKSGLDKMEMQALKSSSKIASNYSKKVGGMIATGLKAGTASLLAGEIYSVKMAGDTEVIEAQFEQSFEGIEDEASKTLSSMSKEFNMFERRLKPGMSQLQSYFRGTGMGEGAFDATNRSIRIAADAAAFNDIAIEDAIGNLKSGLMGNFEALDRLGVNLNKTKLADWVESTKGLTYDDLVENQQAEMILAYIENIQKLSGHVGQATREGTQFQNVTANLKSSIESLGSAIGTIQIPWLSEQVDKLSKFILQLSENVTGFFETLSGFDTFGEKIDYVREKFGFLEPALAFLGTFTLSPALIGGLGLLTQGFAKLKGLKIGGKVGGALSGLFGKIDLDSGIFGLIKGKAGGAIDGLLGKMGTAGTVLGKFGTLFGSTFSTIGSKVVPAIGLVIKALTSLVGIALASVAPTAIIGVALAGLGVLNSGYEAEINKILTMVAEKGPQVIGNFVEGIITRLPDLIDSGSMMVARLLHAITVNLPAIFEGGMSIITTLARGVIDNLDIILPAVIEILGTLTHGILTAIPDLILLGMEILAGLVQGLIDNQPLIMETTIGIMEGFIAKVQENMPQIVELGLGILTNLVEGARNSLPVMLEFAMRVIPDLIGGIMAMLPDIIVAGLDIIMTLVNILLENLPAIIMTGVEILVALIVGILKALPYILIAVGEFIFHFQTGIAKALPEIFMLGLDVIWELIKGIGQGVVEFGKSAIDAVGSLWDRIKNRSKDGVEETNDIVVGKSREMAEGVDNELNGVEQSVGEHGTIVRQEMSESYTGLSNETTSKTGFMRESVLEDFDGMKSGGIERVDYLREGVGNGFGGMETDVSKYTSNIESTTVGDFESARRGVGNSVDGMFGDVTGKYGQITEEVRSSGSNIASGTDTGFQEASNKQRYHMNQMVNSIKTLSTTMKITITGAMNHLTKTVGDGMNLARAIMRSQTSGMVIILRGMYNGFYSAGRYAMAGLQVGLNSRRGSVLATARGIANSVTGTIRSALRIKSPSRVMEELGSYTGEGFEDGLSSWIGRVEKTAGMYADAVIFGTDVGDMANAFMDNVIQTQYEITGAVDNQVSGSVQFYENNGGAPQPLDLTISTPVGDWKLFVEDITEEQNAQIRRGRY